MPEVDPTQPQENPGLRGEFFLVTMIVKPFRLEAVLTALRPFHVLSLTASTVRGYGRQKGHLELYRGAEYEISFIPKVKLEFSVSAAEIEEVLRSLPSSARTGRIGDGKIFVQALDSLHTDQPVAFE
jgi:nitrogen regulatory protein P-II 2